MWAYVKLEYQHRLKGFLVRITQNIVTKFAGVNPVCE